MYADSHLLRFLCPCRRSPLSTAKVREARSARSLKIGTLRPAIILYDEPHPLGDEIGAIQTADVSRRPDLLIIMGTSLKVHGFKKLAKDFAKAVHGSPSDPPSGKPRGKVIFVNKTAPGSEWSDVIDFHIEGESDRWVEQVLEDWKRMRPADWEIQKTLTVKDEGVAIDGFKVVKGAAAAGAKGKGLSSVSFLSQSKSNLFIYFAANKKKQAPGSENVPLTIVPQAKDSKCIPKPPSPSKRLQGSCHYSEVESSPPKKRDVLPCAGKMDVPRLSFVKKCHLKQKQGNEVQKKVKTQESPAPTERKLARTKSKVWIEVPTRSTE